MGIQLRATFRRDQRVNGQSLGFATRFQLKSILQQSPKPRLRLGERNWFLDALSDALGLRLNIPSLGPNPAGRAGDLVAGYSVSEHDQHLECHARGAEPPTRLRAQHEAVIAGLVGLNGCNGVRRWRLAE